MKRKTKRRVGIFLVVAMLAVLIYPAFSSIAEEDSEGFIIENGELTGYVGVGGDIAIPDSVSGISDNVFSGNMSITSVTIPESVVSMGSGVFAGCANLSRVVVPGSVSYMGAGVFSGCSGLSDLSFSANVGEIPANTFYGCSSLGTVSIPGSVSTISDSAFGNCSLMNGIAIPANVQTISGTAFSGCSNLSSINVDGSNASYSSVDGCIYNKTQTTLLYCPEGKGSLQIPSGVSTLSTAALNGCYGITEVTIPASVTTVQSNVFSNSGVQRVTIPKSVESIGSQSSWTPALISTYSGSTGENFAIENNYAYELLDAPATGGETEVDNPETPEQEEDGTEDEEPGGGGGNGGGTGTGGTPGGTNGTSGTSGTSQTTSRGASLAANGVRSASQLAGSQHVLDSTPKTGPELNAKVILCLAVFFVGVYMIISSRKPDEEEEEFA